MCAKTECFADSDCATSKNGSVCDKISFMCTCLNAATDCVSASATGPSCFNKKCVVPECTDNSNCTTNPNGKVCDST